MARETRAEKQARLQHEAEQLQMKQVAIYGARLMCALEESAKFNFSLSVKDGKFVVNDRDSSSDVAELPMEWSNDAQQELEYLEYRTSMKREEAAEAERVRVLKQNALNKLTDEERDALGL